MTHRPRVMIIAGEASGDMHGARLVRSMIRRQPETVFFGIGGHEMEKAGVRILFDAARLSVVGITEAFAKLGTLLKGISTAKRALREKQPDLLILIDFPDFNLHIAGTAKKLNVPVLYYISPQIWAWRSNRVKKIKKRVDHMAVIFPFEQSFYEAYDVPVTFVGHPLMDAKVKVPSCEEGGVNIPSQTTIALLPGSRHKEVAMHLPVMIESAKLLKKRNPYLRFIISCAASVDVTSLNEIVGRYADTLQFEIVGSGIEKVLQRSTMAIAVSGTVTLQAAIGLVPMVIIYKVSPFSYFLGKRLIKVEHIGLINMIGSRRIVPELVQDDASPVNISGHVHQLLNESGRIENMRRNIAAARDKLGGPGASDRVADIAMKFLNTEKAHVT
ncbi:MAG: lipid-A-disaccharide synthase [Desulfobacteraceae bacterium]|nr:lipid-A-disaccharide synthase [Desulfobacteraceae bacterium]